MTSFSRRPAQQHQFLRYTLIASIDCAADAARVTMQGLVHIAADWAKLSHHDAVQGVRQLLKAQVCQLPAQTSRFRFLGLNYEWVVGPDKAVVVKAPGYSALTA